LLFASDLGRRISDGINLFVVFWRGITITSDISSCGNSGFELQFHEMCLILKILWRIKFCRMTTD